VQRAYRRGDLFDKRRRLMAVWATCCTTPATDAKVISDWHAGALLSRTKTFAFDQRTIFRGRVFVSTCADSDIG
jgi:hypothetical protein